MDEKDNGNIVKKVSILGILGNLFLLVLKLIMGLLSKSQAMLADGFNSAGDILASTMSYIGAKMSAKPKDAEHPYGHGKTEYICTIFISISMLLAAFFMLYHSILSILNNDKLYYSIWLVVVALITIILKLLLYLYTKRQYQKFSNILLKANKEDHRNDIFITMGTLIGIVASVYGFYFVDGLVGSITSVWIAIVGVKLFRSAYLVLIDTSINQEAQQSIMNDVEEFEDILHVDSVNSKPAGFKHVVILKISMDGNKTLKEGHELGGKIKEKLMNKYNYILDVIVHINPH